MERIEPIAHGPGLDGVAPAPAIKRLTPKEREDAARERQKRRRDRARNAPRPSGPGEGGGSVDIRA
jgi:hypothetical protein